MATIKQKWKDFTIPDNIQSEYPELIKLILATDSMDDNERQYWFDILPSMTNEQIDRLYDILDTEKRKLDNLEKKYQDEIKNLNEKHLIEWQDFQIKKANKKVIEAKDKDKATNGEEDPDDILKMLNDM